MQTIQEIFGFKETKPYDKSKVKAVDCAAPDQMVGVEIETEKCAFREAHYEAALSGLWAVKTDGSLRGNAFEFISKPAAIKILIPELAEFYRNTGFTNDNYTDRCSIHVHTNVLDMTQQQLGTLCLVYSIVEDVLFEFVNHFGLAESAYRDTNIYCVPWNQCRMNYNMVEGMFVNPDYAFRNWHKYTALNIMPVRRLGTVEWRHMHGTADMEKLTKWLNLIGSVMNFSKKTSFEDVVKVVRELNDTSAYQRFFTDVLGEYLPYEQRYEQALATGVINAKYAIITLKDMKPKPIQKPVRRSLMEDMGEEAGPPAPRLHGFEAGMAALARLQEEPAPAGRFQLNPEARRDNWFDIGGNIVAENPAQPQPAPANPINRVNRADAVDRGRNRRPARAPVRPAPVVADVPLYPYERAIINIGGLHQWGIMDGLVHLYSAEGQQLGREATVVRRDGTYARGFGPSYWTNVRPEWRPEHEAPNVAQQGEF